LADNLLVNDVRERVEPIALLPFLEPFSWSRKQLIQEKSSGHLRPELSPMAFGHESVLGQINLFAPAAAGEIKRPS